MSNKATCSKSSDKVRMLFVLILIPSSQSFELVPMLKLVKLSHSSRLAFYKYYTFQTDKKDIGKAWFAPCYC